MLNVKTLIKTIYNDSRYFYKQEIEGYHIFTDARIMIFIKEGTNTELYKELSETVNRKGDIDKEYLKEVLETFLNGENNINSKYKPDNTFTLIESENGKVTWFSSRLLACISKRYKAGKEFVKNTPTLKHDNFRIYYNGEEDLFVTVLPIHALGNDGVTFRK